MHSPLRTYLAAICLCIVLAASAGAEEDVPAPRKHAAGAPFRIAYYQGGEYKDYLPVLKASLDRLKTAGWLTSDVDACLPVGQTARNAWSCLADSERGPYLRFVEDAFWNSNWNRTTREANREAAILRLASGDIDMVIAMGTWAGQDLANNRHSVPTLVASASNAVAAGIIKSPENSGFDHVHAKVDPTRYARQIRLFHEIAGFHTLGLVAGKTREARIYAGLDQIAPLADELDIKLIICNAPFSDISQEEAEQAVMDCHKKLAPYVDAFYITTHRGVTQENFAELMAPLLDNKVPTFAMGASFEVRRGALMSMSQPEFYYAGGFYARAMAMILNGAEPRDLNQVFEDPHGFSVNVETARIIGFDLPIDVLSEATDIYKEILPYRP